MVSIGRLYFVSALFLALLSVEIIQSAIESPHDTTTFIDQHDNCEFWASISECAKNPNYMLVNCKKSCYKVDPSYYAIDDIDRNAKGKHKKSCGLLNPKVFMLIR